MSDTNLFKRGEVYYARVQIRGRDHRPSLRTTVKSVALKKLRALLDKIEAEKSGGAETHTWKTASVEWAAAMAHSVKPSVLKRYVLSLKAVRSVTDGWLVERVTTKDIAQVVRTRRAAGVTNATIKRDLTAISSVLGYCCAQGWREDNPAKTYDRGVIRERRDPITLPSEEDIAAVVALAQRGMAAAIRYAQYTGMREEEVFSLEWSQVREGVSDLTKTKTSRVRAVPNDERAVGTLAGTKKHDTAPWVFHHGETGERYKNVASNFRQLMRRAIKLKKVKRAFRFHDLRHWFAVDFLRKGGNIYILQKHLGHTSVRTTELYLDFLTPEEQHIAKYGPPAQTRHKGGIPPIGTDPETDDK